MNNDGSWNGTASTGYPHMWWIAGGPHHHTPKESA